MKVSQKPKISTIMSVYNGMPFLKEAVKSILAQTYKNFEFIIVDDSSTDGSTRYLKSLKDKRIKLIINKKNLGLAESLNKALKKTRGKYIARMDADDISLPRRFETQLEFFKKNPKVDLCGSWVKLINEQNRVIGKVHYPTGDAEIKKMSGWITGIIHSTWMAKKNVFDNLKGYDTKFDMAEDLDFLIRAKKFKLANISKELLLWRSPQKRRSQKNVEKMYRISLKVRWKHLKEGNLEFSATPYLIRSLITTYLIPTKIKIFINKSAGLI